MSMPAGGGNQQGAGQQGQQQNGQQQGTNDAGHAQQQAGQPAGGDGSLIAAAAEGQQQDPAGQGTGQGQQQGTGGQQGSVTLEALAQQISGLQGQFTSELDRRINSLTTTLDRRYGGQGQQPNGQQGQGDQGQGGQQQARNDQGRFTGQPAGPDPADVREARQSARDAFNDGGFRFVDPAERQMAMTMAQSEITQRLAGGADPDTAGTAAAAAAVEQIKKLRGTYEQATLRALEAQGRLVTAPGTAQRTAGMPVTVGGPAGQPNQQAGFQTGAARAQQLQQGRLIRPPAVQGQQ